MVGFVGFGICGFLCLGFAVLWLDWTFVCCVWDFLVLGLDVFFTCGFEFWILSS